MNKQTVRRAGRVLALVASFAATAASAATAAGKGSSPEVISGDVTRLRGTFMTKGQAATFELPGGGTVSFFPDTEASLLTDPQMLMLLPSKKTPTFSVILRKGRVDIDVPDKNPPVVAVAVGTPADTRVVTLSGKASLRADGHNVTAVSYVGLTTVTQGPKLLRLPNGTKRTFLGKSGFQEQPLLKATSWIGGKKVWLALRNSVEVSGYSWAPISGAASYAVALRNQTTAQIVAKASTKEPIFESTGLKLTPGQFELEVAGVDREGFLSPEHRSLGITVVGVDLPPGALIQKNDTILLGSDQTVTLTHAQGLTLTTADHRVNVPADAPFGLAKQDHASILVHPPDGGSPTMLSLARRENLVTAWVGPKYATWPMDPVDLRIDLKDDHGNPLNPSIKPTMHVSIGIEPMPVDWVNEGTSFRAQIPAQTGRGPWVVRLEVLDQHGVIIGRDFVEVDRSQVTWKKHVDRPQFEEEVSPF